MLSSRKPMLGAVDMVLEVFYVSGINTVAQTKAEVRSAAADFNN